MPTATKEKPAKAEKSTKPKADKPPESPFPSVPDPAKSGPVFKFDKNNHCSNPIVKTLTTNGVQIHLCVAERGNAWFWSNRIDVPATGEEPAKAVGTCNPFCATDKAMGTSSMDSAVYEAGRDAITAAAGVTLPKGAAKELEFAVSQLQPKAAKRAAEESAIVGYDRKRGAEYMATFNKYGIAHPSGILFREDMDEQAFRDFGGALEHIDQTSKWVRADWYIKGKESFPKLVDKLLSEASKQTILNEAVVARAFPHEERRASLSFSHHAEVAALKKSERTAWLDKAEAEGWSVSKLRKEVTGGKAKVKEANEPLSTGEGTRGGKDGGEGTPQAEATRSEFEETAEELDPKQKAAQEYEKMMEALDGAETSIKNGILKNDAINGAKRIDARKVIARLFELINAAPAK